MRRLIALFLVIVALINLAACVAADVIPEQTPLPVVADANDAPDEIEIQPEIEAQIISRPPENMAVEISDTLHSVLIETAGGMNSAKDIVSMGTVAKVTMQQIEEWNPEFVFFPNYSYFADEEITDNPEWQNVAAVQNGNVYRFPSNKGAWDTASDDNNNMVVCLGLLYITHRLYLEAYSMDELKADALKFYELEGYPTKVEFLV